MKLNKIMKLILILSFLLIGSLLINNNTYAASDTSKVVLTQATNTNEIAVSINKAEGAGIASFQMGLHIETDNVSNVEFVWSKTLSDYTLQKYNYDKNARNLYLYFVSTQDQGTIDKIEVGTIKLKMKTEDETTVKISPIESSVSAASIASKNTDISPIETLSAVVEGNAQGDDPSEGEENPNNPSGGDEENPSNPSGGDEENPNNPSGGDEENPSNPSGGDEENPSNPSGGDEENPNNPSGGDEENPSNPSEGEEENPSNPSGGNNENSSTPTGDNGEDTNNLPSGNSNGSSNGDNKQDENNSSTSTDNKKDNSNKSNKYNGIMPFTGLLVNYPLYASFALVILVVIAIVIIRYKVKHKRGKRMK